MRILRPGALALALLAAGCNPNGAADLSLTTRRPASSGEDGDPAALECAAPAPGPAPMRRLSQVELRYALEDLFGDPALAVAATESLTPDPVSLGYSNSALLLDVKSVLGQELMVAAETVAAEVVKDLPSLLPCDPAVDGEDACAAEFIRTFGRRAFRRPLTDAEVQGYLTRFAALRDGWDFTTGVEWIVGTMLQSPLFLYRPEPDPEEKTVRKVAPYELASRLSFLVWHSVPDEALLAAAAEGRLATARDVEREARRMLEDPKAARLLNFIEEWLDVDKLGPYARDPEVYGELPPDLTELFRTETRTFAREVIFEGGGGLEALLTADYTYANDALAAHYGLPQPGTNDFVKIALPASRRGIWMQGGPLTAHDKARRTSIVLRGVRVRTALLCQNIPAPPDNVDLDLGPIDQTASQADRLAQHRQNPSCAGCHQLLDPVGQLFENVDAVGRLRTQDEAGRPVDTAGEVTSTADLDGEVSGGAQLLLEAAKSESVRTCFATQLFRYAHGREETARDACSQRQAYQRFADSGFDVRELVLGIALSDDFLYRQVQ